MLASHKGEIPFVVFLMPFLLGIALALGLDCSAFNPVLVRFYSGFLLVFILLNIFYRHIGLHRKAWVGGVLIHLLLIIAGMMAAVNYDSRNRTDYFGKYRANALLVKVTNEPQLKNGILRFTAEVELNKWKNQAKPVSGTLLLALRQDSAHHAAISYGDELVIPANYKPVDPPFNPAEFNYKQYLAHQNIYAQAFLNPQEVVVLNHHAGNPVIAYSLQLRQNLVAQFKRYMHSNEAIAVASTLILGYKADLSDEVLQAYSKTGTIHVLSVSGAHVAIIFWMIGWLLGFIDRYRHGKLLKAILSIGLIWYYSLLTGLSPAVCRAAVMISLLIIGKAYNRRINSLNLLAASAFLLLLTDPFLITDVGFQLSYLAVAGLVVFQPIVYHWLDVENRWLNKLWLLCSVSIAAQVITFPLSAYYFHQFPVYFLLSNLFIVPLAELIMFVGIRCLVCAKTGIGFAAKCAGWVLEKCILVMDKGLQLIEHAPFSTINKIWLNRMEYLLLFGLVILLFCLVYYKKPALLKVGMCGLLLLCCSLSWKWVESYHTNNITFFNLKKHPAILFKQGERGMLVTDLADTDKAYRYSIQPCLDSCHISKLSRVKFSGNALTSFAIKDGHLVRFLGKQVLLFDKSFDNASPQKLPVDYLYAMDNPHIAPADMMKSYPYHLLIAGADNSPATIKRLGSALSATSKNIYVLKSNKSLIILSN